MQKYMGNLGNYEDYYYCKIILESLRKIMCHFVSIELELFRCPCRGLFSPGGTWHHSCRDCEQTSHSRPSGENKYWRANWIPDTNRVYHICFRSNKVGEAVLRIAQLELVTIKLPGLMFPQQATPESDFWAITHKWRRQQNQAGTAQELRSLIVSTEPDLAKEASRVERPRNGQRNISLKAGKGPCILLEKR